MARPLRIEHEGAVYHILSRGNRAEFIFQDDSDKDLFLQIIARAVERYGLEVYAYCIMGNHYHLLTGIPVGMLSKAMHMIQSSYGSHLRRQREWIGHVFAGRYKSLCVEKEGYLLELSRYIHLNPVRAGIVERPEDYPWSSYRFYLAKEEKPRWLSLEWLLQEYGTTYWAAQRRYRQFIEAGIESAPGFPAKIVVGQAMLGSNEFVERVIECIEKEGELGDVVSKRHYVRSLDLQKLLDAVRDYYGEKVITKGREGGRSRDMFVYLAKKYTTALNGEIGQKAGGVTFSAVAHRYSRIMKMLEQEDTVRKKWEKEGAEILSRFKG